MSVRPERVLRFAAPALVLGLGVALFAGTLKAPFTSDDVLVAIENNRAQDASNIPLYFLNDLDWILPEELQTPENQKSIYGIYRPMLSTSYTIDAYLYGQAPWGWRLDNLILHLICSLLFLGLANRLLGSRPAGLAAGLLFAAHPIHIEAVASLMGGRAELLACMFMLSSWWIFLLGDQRSGWRRIAVDCGSAFLFLLGLFSKENAVMLPGILFLSGWILRGQSIRTLIVRMLPHAVVFVSFVVLRFAIVGRLAPADWSLVFGDLSGFGTFLGIMAILASYLRLVLLPWPLHHPACYNDLPLTVPALVGVLCALLVLGLIGLAAWRAVRGRRAGRAVWWAFAVLFFYLCLVPVAHIIPFRVTMAERFLYIPSAGLCLLAGWLFIRARAWRRWLPLAAGLPLLAGYATGVLVANARWTDLDRLYLDLIECNPRSADPYNNMGTHRLRQGKPEEALPFFKKAVELEPQMSQPRYNIGLIYQRLGKYEQAEQAYRKNLEFNPDHGKTLNNLGNIVEMKGDFAEARKLYQRAAKVDPAHPGGHVNLGNLEMREGHLEEAERLFRLAIRLDTRVVESRFNLARLLGRTGREAEAERLYREILELRPDYYMAWNNLGNFLKDRGQLDEAERNYLTALEIEPDCVPAHYNLGNLLLMKNDPARAAARFQEALKRQPDYLDALVGLAAAHLRLGNKELAREAASKAASLAPDDPRIEKLLRQAADDE